MIRRVLAGLLATVAFATVHAADSLPHWAYQPVSRPAPPTIQNTSWQINEIDRFILAKLEQHGIQSAPTATSAVLCRRLYFDLTGLPPTPDQLTTFESTAAANLDSAISDLVNRLLDSPEFGEHFGRHWLDVARFGESLSLRGFILKNAWRYRDYVIDSFNRDESFPQFIREQLAGDLLSEGQADLATRRRQRVAVTFLALGNTNLEEQDKKQLDMDVVDEQLDTLGKAFLGQTIGCARCHDHKFDPIPTRDYYAMAGILRNTRLLKHANVSEWLEFPLPVQAAEETKFKKHEAAIASLESEIQTARETIKKLSAKSTELTAESATNSLDILLPRQLPGILVDSAQARQVGSWKHSTFSNHYIGDGYLHDDNTAKGEKTLTFQPDLPRPGRYEVRLAYIPARNRSTNIPVTIFHADGETIVPINELDPPAIDARFVSLGTFRFETNGFAHVLVSNEGTRGYVTADAVQFLSEDGPSETQNSKLKTQNPPSRQEPLRRGEGSKPKTQNSKLETRDSPDVKSLEERLKKLKASGPKRPMTMGVSEVNPIADAPIHIRGSVHNLGAVVPRGFLTWASGAPPPSLPKNESGRRQLADWIASPSNPLTARVYVNRVWLWIMGEGLVRTPDNFGTTGESPSHPELLDYLAEKFMEQNWSTKRLVREIVLSRTYRLNSSDRNSQGLRQGGDPENRLLSHAARRRLSAEQLRDAILVINGQLAHHAGGPSYSPALTADFGFKFNEPIRSVYAPVFRNALPELFDAFDFPSPCAMAGKRNASTVPTQALYLLNHPWVGDQARIAAHRALDETAGNEAARIDLAYRATLGRFPNETERTQALRHLKSVGKSKRLEAWSELFHALFASADFRYLD